uniref:Uncharacterized protein n=1 Tax=Candidatus Kentrum sp. MB TaxID=2138164 RepID=A0A450XVV2_9GAMM|nr:MAG: hypothetical protein BECKMB1821I_GA0114274_104522 [Candidatus Kentron sp. MB]VFK76165.1 MAG: hypothetical protein BECKMB1821H_GA0114242_104422 [Candidatus Kentron sp. MB]
MSHAFACSIEYLGIDAVELPHTFGQIRIRRFHEQVVMVSHQVRDNIKDQACITQLKRP